MSLINFISHDKDAFLCLNVIILHTAFSRYIIRCAIFRKVKIFQAQNAAQNDILPYNK
jgi:hypothetical protein